MTNNPQNNNNTQSPNQGDAGLTANLAKEREDLAIKREDLAINSAEEEKELAENIAKQEEDLQRYRDELKDRRERGEPSLGIKSEDYAYVADNHVMVGTPPRLDPTTNYPIGPEGLGTQSAPRENFPWRTGNLNEWADDVQRHRSDLITTCYNQQNEVTAKLDSKLEQVVGHTVSSLNGETPINSFEKFIQSHRLINKGNAWREEGRNIESVYVEKVGECLSRGDVDGVNNMCNQHLVSQQVHNQEGILIARTVKPDVVEQSQSFEDIAKESRRAGRMIDDLDRIWDNPNQWADLRDASSSESDSGSSSLRERENKGSLLDDFADPSTEPADYMGWDD